MAQKSQDHTTADNIDKTNNVYPAVPTILMHSNEESNTLSISKLPPISIENGINSMENCNFHNGVLKKQKQSVRRFSIRSKYYQSQNEDRYRSLGKTHHQVSPRGTLRTSNLAQPIGTYMKPITLHYLLQQSVLYLECLRLLYYIFSVPLRIGMFHNPFLEAFEGYHRSEIWSSSLSYFCCMDLVADALGIYIVLKRAFPGYFLFQSHTNTQHFNGKHSAVQSSAIAASLRLKSNARPLAHNDTWYQSHSSTKRARKHTKDNRATDCTSQSRLYHGWQLDLIMILPIEILNVHLGRYNGLHFVRVTKLLAIRDLYSLIRRMEKRWTGSYIVQMLQQHVLISLIFYLQIGGIIWIHYSAMGYWYIANLECGINFERCPHPAIDQLDYQSWALADQLRHSTALRKYLRATYWGSRTIITLGFQDVLGVTIIETAYMIFAEFVSALWCASLISTWAYYFVAEKAPEHTHDVFLYDVKHYLTDIDAPDYLKDQIIGYLEYDWNTTRQFSEENFLKVLQREHLQSEFRSELKTWRLLRVPIFAEQSVGFVHALAIVMEFKTFAPLDWIIKSPNLQERMFVVVSGYVAITNRPLPSIILTPTHVGKHKNPVRGASSYLVSSEAGQKAYTCVAGDIFGATSLFHGMVLEEEAFSETYSLMLTLTKADFEKTLYTYYAENEELLQETWDSIAVAAKDYYYDFKQRKRHAYSSSNSHMKTPPLTLQSTIIDDNAPCVATTYYDAQTEILRQEKPWQHPQSKFRRKWELYRAMFTCYLAVEIPYIVIFYYGINGNFGEWGFNLTYILGLLTELFFYVDFYYNCFEFYAPESPDQLPGKQSPARILKHYKANGMYLDLFANLPLALLFDSVDGFIDLGRQYNFLSLLRLLRFLRVRRLNMLVRKTLHAMTGATQFIVYCSISIFVYCHFVGCLWYIIGSVISLKESIIASPPSYTDCIIMAQNFHNCSWTVKDGLHEEGVDKKLIYLRSLYFSISTFTTVAYGDILPYTDIETLVVAIMSFIGGSICYSVIGAMGSAIARLATKARAINDHENLVNRFFVKYSISLKLQTHIRRFNRFLELSNSQIITERNVFKTVSQGLKYRLSQFIHEHTVRNAIVRNVEQLRESSSYSEICTYQSIVSVPQGTTGSGNRQSKTLQLDHDSLLFPTLTSSEFIKAIAEQMIRTNYYDCENILLAGEVPSSLFIIRSGCVRLKNYGSRTSIGLAFDGHVLNDVAFFLQLPNKYDAVPTRVTEVSAISYQDFQVLESHYPEEFAICKQYAQERKESLQARYDGSDKTILECEKSSHLTSMEDDNNSWKGNSGINAMYSQRKSIRNIPRRVYGVFYHFSQLIITTFSFQRTPNSQIIMQPGHEKQSPQRFSPSFRTHWEVLIAVIIFYDCVFIVARLAYRPIPSPQLLIVITTIDWIADLFLLSDIYFKWNYFAPRTDITGKMTIAQIRAHYKRKWFYQDLIASLPLYYIGSNFHIMSMCRVPRLLRLRQLGELSRNITALLARRYPSSISQSLIGLGNVCLLFFLCCHFGGSVFYALANDDPSRGWLAKDVVLIYYKPQDIFPSYIRAFYWAMSTFTVVNYGDIVPLTFKETFWACMICLIGTLFMSNVGGEIVDIINSFDRARSIHEAHIEEFHSLAQAKNIPVKLREKVSRYFKFRFSLCEGLDPSKIFADLPPVLKRRLYGELYSQLIDNLSLFTPLSSIQRDELASNFRPQLYLPNDVILYEQSAGDGLCIMKIGRAEVIRLDTSVVMTIIHEGQLFGEVAFFNAQVHRLATVRALAYCEVLHMKKSDWEKFAAKPANSQVANLVILAAKHNLKQYAKICTNIADNLGLDDLHEERLEDELIAYKALNREPGPTDNINRQMSYSRLTSMRSRRESMRLFANSEQFPNTNSDLITINSKTVVRSQKLQKMFSPVTSFPPVALASTNIKARSSVPVMSSTSIYRPSSTAVTIGRVTQTDIQSNYTLNRKSHDLTTLNKLGVDDTACLTYSELLFHDQKRKIPQNPIQSELLSLANPVQHPTARRRNSILASTICQTVKRNDHRRSSASMQDMKVLEVNKRAGETPQNDNAKRRKGESHRQQPWWQRKGVPFMAQLFFSQRSQVLIDGLQPAPTQLSELDLGITMANHCEQSFTDEGSHFRALWDACKTIATIYYIIAIPFRAAFYWAILDATTSFTLDMWLDIETSLDIFFWLDIYMNWFHFRPVVHGEPVQDRAKCKEIYRKKGSLYVDVAASIPFEWIVYIPRFEGLIQPYIDINHLSAIIRLENLIRFAQIGDLISHMEHHFFYTNSTFSIRQDVLSYLKIIVMCLISSHWIACLWFFIGGLVLYIHQLSWLLAPMMLTPEGQTIETISKVPLGTIYMKAYHYAIGSISTVTYGDISPRNLSETLVQIPIIFLCIVFYGYITGSVRKLLERNLNSRIAFEQQMVRVKKFALHHTLSRGFAMQVARYLHEQMSNHGSWKQAQTLSHLNAQLRRDVLVTLRKDLVQHGVHPFPGFTPFLIHAVMSALHEELYAIRDLIYEEHATGMNMYFVEHGTVLLTTLDRSTSQFHVKKTVGQFFGANSLLYGTAREESARAVTKCHLAVLNIRAYQRIITIFPEHADIIRIAWTTGARRRQTLMTDRLPSHEPESSSTSIVESREPLTTCSSSDVLMTDDVVISSPLLSPSRAVLMEHSRSNRQGHTPLRHSFYTKDRVLESLEAEGTKDFSRRGSRSTNIRGIIMPSKTLSADDKALIES